MTTRYGCLSLPSGDQLTSIGFRPLSLKFNDTGLDFNLHHRFAIKKEEEKEERKREVEEKDGEEREDPKG